jgi:hypothetical protein
MKKRQTMNQHPNDSVTIEPHSWLQSNDGHVAALYTRLNQCGNKRYGFIGRLVKYSEEERNTVKAVGENAFDVQEKPDVSHTFRVCFMSSRVHGKRGYLHSAPQWGGLSAMQDRLTDLRQVWQFLVTRICGSQIQN